LTINAQQHQLLRQIAGCARLEISGHHFWLIPGGVGPPVRLFPQFTDRLRDLGLIEPDPGTEGGWRLSAVGRAVAEGGRHAP
jgi:hypothetical protein